MQSMWRWPAGGPARVPRLVDHAVPINPVLEEPVVRSRACRPKEDGAVLERHHRVKPRLAGTGRVLPPSATEASGRRSCRSPRPCSRSAERGHTRVCGGLRAQVAAAACLCLEGCGHRSWRPGQARTWSISASKLPSLSTPTTVSECGAVNALLSPSYMRTCTAPKAPCASVSSESTSAALSTLNT